MPITVDFSKLSDFVKNDLVKKDVYDKLVTKVNNIDTNGFVLKTKYDTDKSELEKKIPDTSDLDKKTDYSTKITEITEGKIGDISSLATKTTLTSVENKIPSVNNLVKKTDYDTKITGIENKLNNHNHDKYIDTSEFNKLHCAKNHISQVLDYHRKLKKAMYISSFHQLFGCQKDRISHHRKHQNKNFSVTSKYHLSTNFLTQKKAVFSITENFNTRPFQQSVNIIFQSTLWLKKRPYFQSPKRLKQDLFFNQ